jgi:hypothetical protein
VLLAYIPLALFADHEVAGKAAADCVSQLMTQALEANLKNVCVRSWQWSIVIIILSQLLAAACLD